jgi:hypothetical protein
MMKISTTRIKQIIKEELFYRQFYREGSPLAEDKVGDKIKKLEDEGKPQKQAVAIALDMERHKKLEEATPEQVRADIELPPGVSRAEHSITEPLEKLKQASVSLSPKQLELLRHQLDSLLQQLEMEPLSQ